LLDEFEALALGKRRGSEAVQTEEIVVEEDGGIEGLMPEVDHEGHVRFFLFSSSSSLSFLLFPPSFPSDDVA